MDRVIIDRITYLASLASEPKEIDIMLDTLRTETAELTDTATLTPEQQTKLAELEQDLKVYLVEQDPLRTFTPQSLEDRLDRQFNTNNQRVVNREMRLTFAGVLFIAAVLFGLPMLPFIPIPDELRTLVAIPLILNGLHIAAAWFFFTGLKEYRPELRRAFIFLCVGIVVMGLTEMQISFLPIWSETLWVQSAAFMLPYMAGLSLIYVGLRRVAKTLQVRTWASSLKIIWPLIILFAVALVLMPHGQGPIPEAAHSAAVVTLHIATVVSLAGMVVAWAISRTLGRSQSKTYKWIAAAMLCAAFGAGAHVVVYMMQGFANGQIERYLAFPFVLAELLLLWAGYTFKKNARY